MKVLLVHNWYRTNMPSGENTAVYRLADPPRSAGHAVEFCVAESDAIEHYTLLQTAALPARSIWSMDSAKRIRAAISKFRPDVVHVHNTFPLLSPSVLRAAHGRARVIATIHNYRLLCANGLLMRDDRPCTDCVARLPIPAIRHRCYRGGRAATAVVAAGIISQRLIGAWRRWVDGIICLSEFSRDELTRGGLDETKVFIVPNFADRTAGDEPAGPRERAAIVACRLSREKGIDLACDAWKKRFGTLWVIGDGPERTRLSSLGVGKDIRFVGNQSREYVLRRMGQVRAVVVPSRVYESSPLVIAEALSRGAAVVVPRHGAFLSHLDDPSVGIFFHPGSSELLQAALERALFESDPDCVARHAAELFERRFSPEAHLGAVLQIYKGGDVR